MFANILKFYQGAITYDQMMSMSYKEFLMYYDYMLYLQRQESEDGRKTNELLDNTDKRRFNKR